MNYEIYPIVRNKSKFNHFITSHLDISTSGHLDPISAISNHIILHNLPVPNEVDTMATVFIYAITTKLNATVFLHCNTTSTIFKNGVCNQSGQLTALQHGNADAAVTVDEVGKNI